MGRLKPGALYTYEHVDGATYSIRDNDPSTKIEIGRILKKNTLDESSRETKLWHNIRRAAKSNSALQDALDRVKIVYELSKDHGEK